MVSADRQTLYPPAALKTCIMEFKEIIKQAARIVAEELDVSYKLFLFGSRAEDVHDEKSDIDIGIIPDSQITAEQLLNIQEKLERIPTLLKIDFVDFSTASDEFKKTALWARTQKMMEKC